MMYTGERLIPDSFGIGDRIMVEHLDRYRFAAHMINDHQKRRQGAQQHPSPSSLIRILDAPCGVGYGAALLAEQAHADVVGLDSDEETVAYARQRYGAVPGLSFEVVNLDTDSLDEIDDEPFKAVVCFEGIEHVVQQAHVAQRLCEAASRYGLVIVSTPRRGGPGAGSEFHTRELLREELYDLFWPHLSSIQMYGQDLQVGDCPPNDDARYYVLVGTK